MPTQTHDRATAARNRAGLPTTWRLVISAAVGVAVGLAAGVPAKWDTALLCGWIAGAGSFNLWLWLTIRHMNPDATARHAVSEDPGRAITDIAVLIAAVASLLGVGIVIASTSSAHGLSKALQVAVSVVSVAVAWMLVHLSYTTRYARLYYTGAARGVDFHDEDKDPQYSDFAYLAFTIGMTFQVSDPEVTNKTMRLTILRHSMLAYLFGAVIVATVVNLLAGLSK
ncbi:MAG: hypothetical protein QOF57_523 [Frankiaceae bacterium]|nr:hypothetical protein [Frankiaceae bacterium]